MSSYDISLESFTPNDIKAMHSLLTVTEELLFAFPLPSELVKKYETMKEKVFTKVNLANNPSKLWKMQREAYAKQKSCKRDIGIQSYDQNQELEKIRDLKWKELEENANVIRWELLARLEASHYINKSYQNLTNLVLSSSSHILTRVATLLGIQMNQNTFMVLTPDEIPHEDMPEVNWNLPELEAQNAVSLSKFKELELKEANKLEDARFDYQQREAQILNFIDQLENFVINKEEAFETLQKECKDLSDELVKQQFIYEEKIKNTHEMLTLDKITLEKRFQKEREDLKAASEQYLDNVKKSHELQMERLELEKVSTEAKVKKLAEEKSKIHEESTEVVQIVKEELKKQKDETRKVTESLRDAFVEKEELQNKNVKLETYVVNAKEKIIKLEHEIDGKDNIIENIRLTLKKENLHLKENYEKQISDITHGSKTETETLKNFHEQELKYAKSQLEDMQGKLEETQFKMQKIVKTLEEEIRHEQEIRLKLEERLMEHEQVLPEYEKIQLHRDQLQEAHYDAEKALDYIKARAGPVYNKHVESQRDWNEQDKMQFLLNEGIEVHAETVIYIEFMVYYLSKSVNDNNWLIDRVAELGQEIDKLRYLKATPVKVVMTPSPSTTRDDSLHKQIWRDIRGTSRALQEFEKSREKLIQHFQEST